MSNNYLEDNIYWRLHHGGFFNRFYSFQIGMGLAHTFNKNLVVYNIKDQYGTNILSPALFTNTPLGPREEIITKTDDNFFDLIEYDRTLLRDKILLPNIDNFTKDEIKYNKEIKNYYCVSGSNNYELEFSKNKIKIELEPIKNYHFNNTSTLSNYSTFFLNRTLELDRVIDSVKIKKEYRDFAKMVAESLGEFNGIHARMTDHKHVHEIQEKEILDAIVKLKGKKIVVLTDEIKNDIWKNKDVIFFDNFILDNFKEEFLSLSSRSEIVFGLIGALVMSYANDFIGTYGSTFTSFIQRNILNKKEISFKFLGKDIVKDSDIFSWLDYIDGPPIEFVRDWKESKIKKEAI